MYCAEGTAAYTLLCTYSSSQGQTSWPAAIQQFSPPPSSRAASAAAAAVLPSNSAEDCRRPGCCWLPGQLAAVAAAALSDGMSGAVFRCSAAVTVEGSGKLLLPCNSSWDEAAVAAVCSTDCAAAGARRWQLGELATAVAAKAFADFAGCWAAVAAVVSAGGCWAWCGHWRGGGCSAAWNSAGGGGGGGGGASHVASAAAQSKGGSGGGTGGGTCGLGVDFCRSSWR